MSLDNLQIVWPGWETARLIGRGGFGAVYEIRQDAAGEARSASVSVIRIPQREAELEALRDEGYDDAELAAHFLALRDQVEKAFRALNALGDGANVVRCGEIRSVRHEDGIGWDVKIMTEPLAPLPGVLSFPAEEEKVLRIGTDLCRALAACSGHGILHGDIKPASIYVAGDWSYRLGDFGLSGILEASGNATVRADVGLFAAPEVLRGEPAGEKADQYSLGLVLYWLLNEGRGPFLPLPPAQPSGTQLRQAVARRQSGEALPPPAHGSDALRQLVLKACAFDPAARFPGAEEMLLALEALLPSKLPEEEDEGTVADGSRTEGEISRNQIPLSLPVTEDEGTVDTRRPKAAAAPKAADTVQPPRKKKARWPLFAALALLLALVIGGAVFLLRSFRETWAEPRYEWSEDHSAVTAVRACESDPDKTETETVQTVSKVLSSPTCEDMGRTAYIASFSNPAFETQTEEFADLPALGHDWGTVQYTWSEDHRSCTAERVCATDPSHRETETVQTSSRVSVAATCGTPGNTTYTADFQHSAFVTQTKTLANLPALGHDWGEAHYQWSEDHGTCTAERVCANDPSHRETETVQASSRISVAATCLTTGEATYTASFSNPAFETQSEEVSNVPATGHRWGAVSYSWSGDCRSCTAERVCLNDPSHKETETVRTSSRISAAATCLAAGETTYTASFQNSAFASQTKTVSNLPASGHLWGAADYTWSSDKSTCTATRVCLNDPSHKETETVRTSSWVSTPATCTEGGKTTYTASFRNSAFAAQTRTISDQIALGHSWRDATYSAPKTCSRCGATSGNVKGWLGEPSCHWGDTQVMLRGYQTSYPLEYDTTIYNCRKLTMDFTIDSYTGYPFGEWYLYAKGTNGKWQQVGLFEVKQSAPYQTYTVVFPFDPTISFTALSVVMRGDAQYSVTYYLRFYDMQQYVG